MHCDAFIRSTTTDGDSLSVHEALHLKKDVIASNVVDRPIGTLTYLSASELEFNLLNFDKFRGRCHSYNFSNNIDKLRNLYFNLLNNVQ